MTDKTLGGPDRTMCGLAPFLSEPLTSPPLDLWVTNSLHPSGAPPESLSPLALFLS